jgi:hypothetical protein
MAINFLTDYPKELTNKAWQKEKSVMDKLKGKTKTGLGDELEAAEAAWNKINWDSMHADNAMLKVDKSGKYKNESEFDFAKKNAEAELKGAVASARKALMKASGTARDTSMNKDLSKDAIAKAKAISAGLLDLEGKLRDIKLDDFDQKKDHWKQLMAMQIKGLKTAADNLEEGLKKVVQTPTKVTWNQEVKQKFRSVGNTLGNFDQFKDLWKDWVKLDGLQADRHPVLSKTDNVDPAKEKEIIIGLVKEALPHLKSLKTVMSKI